MSDAAAGSEVVVSASRCVVAVCGLPGAGKSTLCAALFAAAPEGAVHVVSFDAFDGAVPGIRRDGGGSLAFDPVAWRAARRDALGAVARALESEDGPPVVVADDTLHLRGMRRELWALARDARAAFVLLHVACDDRQARARNAAREGAARVPEDVLDRMAAAFEAPDGGRHPFERRCVVVDTGGDGTSGADAWDRVRRAWGAPPPPKVSDDELAARRAEGNAANAASAVKAVDVESRARVGAVIGAAPPERRREAAKALEVARRELLAAARQAVRDGGAALEAARAAFEATCAVYG